MYRNVMRACIKSARVVDEIYGIMKTEKEIRARARLDFCLRLELEQEWINVGENFGRIFEYLTYWKQIYNGNVHDIYVVYARNSIRDISYILESTP